MRILMISLWFNQVLPSSAGGDVVRIWLLRRRGGQWSQAVKGVMADRFTALLGLVALMVAGLPFLVLRVHNSAADLAIGGLAAAGVAGTIVLLTLDRWRRASSRSARSRALSGSGSWSGSCCCSSSSVNFCSARRSSST
jgi:uncharacterized membrane protein YbhN (UPF0104 family)